MLRLPVLLLLVPAISLAGGAWAAGQDSPAPPQSYELMINGESFLLDLDRQTKLASRQKPGTTYQVAVRISPIQRIELNTLRVQYEWPAAVFDDHGRPERAVRIRHELGFTVLLTDIGRPIEAKDQALGILSQTVATSLKESGGKDLNVGKPYDRKFAGSDAKGVTIRYQDSQGFPQTCGVYLLSGPTFVATCVIQYSDKDSENSLPKIKAVLDSVQGLR